MERTERGVVRIKFVPVTTSTIFTGRKPMNQQLLK
uniref:Uncharacterized protein n=1 Tax=Anguilla anguilla TaxID=7936 RepID=A0A0E9UTA9_ANGAN